MNFNRIVMVSLLIPFMSFGYHTQMGKNGETLRVYGNPAAMRRHVARPVVAQPVVKSSRLARVQAGLASVGTSLNSNKRNIAFVAGALALSGTGLYFGHRFGLDKAALKIGWTGMKFAGSKAKSFAVAAAKTQAAKYAFGKAKSLYGKSVNLVNRVRGHSAPKHWYSKLPFCGSL